MTFKPGKQYISQLISRYQNTNRSEKQTILDELVKTTGYHRKSAIRILTGNYRYHTGPIKRPQRLTDTASDAVLLEKICELLGWINSKRVQSQLEKAVPNS